MRSTPATAAPFRKKMENQFAANSASRSCDDNDFSVHFHSQLQQRQSSAVASFPFSLSQCFVNVQFQEAAEPDFCCQPAIIGLEVITLVAVCRLLVRAAINSRRHRAGGEKIVDHDIDG